jgi:serine/threonine protein kinase/tetratricopeptide (TPR) repeat protein
MKIIIGGRYEFDPNADIIGRGGMGAVYRGRDTQTGDVVAIKQLRPDIPTDNTSMFAARFKREGDILRHILQNIQHPNIINLIQVISDAEQGQFLVMDYVGGGSLWDELQSYPQLPIPRALSIAQAMASALMALHHQNVIHRDIKPSNILIADDKSPRLCDFGVVHVESMTRMTSTDGVIGTLDYISPEQLNGESVAPSCDIWAFGVMLFEMLAGKRPFHEDNMGAVVTAIITKPHPNLKELRPDIPPALVRLVDVMLIKNPRERISSMKIVYESLEAIANGGDISSLLTSVRLPSQRLSIQRIGTLPQNFTDMPFYDRDHQRAEIANLITDKKPFISIYGRGGIGKTALVSKVLGDFERTGFIDGVAYLRANSTPPLNINSLLGALSGFLPHDHDVHTTLKNATISVTEKTHALINGLVDGHYVVFVDNLETLQHDDNHTLIDDELRQFFETVLERRGDGVMTLLITSRYPIPFPNTLKAYESVVRLDDGLPKADALRFLREMDSQKVLPDTDTQLHIWIERVAGFPRGLEALVGYLNGGDTRHMEDLLDDPNLFEGEVLSNIVHHAHNTLPADFRQVLAGVAVIGQSTTRAELEYLLTPYMESAHLRHILERLVESRFLAYHRQNRIYSLHPIDLAYALSSTTQGSSADDDTAFTRYRLHGRMADYYKNGRKPKEERNSLDDIQPQLREIEHHYAMGNYDHAVMVLKDGISDYLRISGNIELAYNLHLRLQGKVKNLELAGYNSGMMANVSDRLQRIDDSLRYLTIALEQSRAAGDKLHENKWLINLGVIHFNSSQTETAISYFEQALAITREIQNVNEEAFCLGNLGTGYRILSQFDMALGYYEQASAIYQQIKNYSAQSTILYYLGSLYTEMGELEKGIDYCQRALAFARDYHRREQEIWNLQELGRAYTMQCQFDKAIEHLELANTLARDMKSPLYLQGGLYGLAMTHWLAHDLSNAHHTITQAREYDHVPFSKDSVLIASGCIAVCMENLVDAKIFFESGLTIINTLLADSPSLYDKLYARGVAHIGLWLATDDAIHHTQAMQAFHEAKTICGYAGVILQYRQQVEALLACNDKNGAALMGMLV